MRFTRRLLVTVVIWQVVYFAWFIVASEIAQLMANLSGEYVGQT